MIYKKSYILLFILSGFIITSTAFASATNITIPNSFVVPVGQQIDSYDSITGITKFRTNIISSTNSNQIKCDGITDDTQSIQSAINSLNLTGGIVLLPSGHCKISNTIQIGNGNPILRSGINDITLQGTGGRSTSFDWYGSSTIPMLQINGPTWGIHVNHVQFDGRKISTNPIKIIQTEFSSFDDLYVINWHGTAYNVTTWNNYNAYFGGCDNRFSQIATGGPADNQASGVSFDSNITNYDSCRNVIQNLSIQYGGNIGTYGLRLGFTDNNSFQEGLLQPVCNCGGYGVLLNQKYTIFPHENKFDNIAVVQGVGGISGTGGNWFNPYPTMDGEPIPNMPYIHYVLYNGTIR